MRRSVRSTRGSAKRKPRRTVSPDEQFDATTFFERVIPTMLEKNRLGFSRLEGTICFWVYDVGTWTIHLGERDLAKAVMKETHYGADLVAAFNKQTFSRFLAGEQIEPDNGCYFDGDVTLLSRFARMLEMPQGMIALRAANM